MSWALDTLRTSLAQAERDIEAAREKVANAEREAETARTNVRFWKDDLAETEARRDDLAAAVARLGESE